MELQAVICLNSIVMIYFIVEMDTMKSIIVPYVIVRICSNANQVENVFLFHLIVMDA